MKYLPALLSAALFAAPFAIGPAHAFERSDDKLFIGWPTLAVDDLPGRETQVYAIANEYGEVVYVIVYNMQGRLQPLGAYACNEKFAVLASVSNGFRDIECVNDGARAVLRADSSGSYLYTQ